MLSNAILVCDILIEFANARATVTVIERLGDINLEDWMLHAAALRQEQFHAGATTTSLLEFRGVDRDRLESFLLKDCLQLRAGTGCHVPAVHDDSVTHKGVGFLYIEQMNGNPILVDGCQGVGGERSGENEDGEVVQRTQAGVEVVSASGFVPVTAWQQSPRV